MIGDPRDAWAYRLAVGALGLAVAIALAGAIVIVALGDPTTSSPSSTTSTTTKTTTTSRIRGGSKVATVSKASTTDTPMTATASVTPIGLYVVGGALTGALLGILIPLPWPSRLRGEANGDNAAQTDGVTRVFIGLAAAALLVVFVATITVGVVQRIVSLEVLGAASGAALLGLFVPSPAMRQ
ncbi:MAG TPA: hypothetical protein VGY30_01430 [Solirubrobacteraceae bacterium]|jgi:hypothetical protein|nr:hypothetical protein [Solirubrobacteraceae bacterium]